VTKLATSFASMADAMKQIRDDIHEMRKELRSDLKSHSEQLGELSQRVAIVETKVK
jgi:Sec-independent protein translocase protein TatA